MSKKCMNKGFTLVELVIGIVVLAIAMMVMNTMLISQSKDALEPVYRLRASQLGQSILQDILSRAYDQKSDHNGGHYRCGEVWGDDNLWFDGKNWKTSGKPKAVPCTAAKKYGTDGIEIGEPADHKHPDFNDVDDFISKYKKYTKGKVGFVKAVDYGNVLGGNLPAQYNNYAVKIAVSADKSSGILMKRIDVTIKTPTDEEIVFSALKGNY